MRKWYSIMRIALVETTQLPGNDIHPMDNSIPDGMRRAAEAASGKICEAAAAGAELICFPQWFVGFGNIAPIPNKITQVIQNAARDNRMVVVTGTFRTPGVGMKSHQCSLVIDQTGEVVSIQEKRNLYPLEEQWQLSSPEINPGHTSIGRVVISHGDDAADSCVYEAVRNLSPHVWVLQTNDALDVTKWVRRPMAFRELVAQRAQELNAVVVCPMLKGEFMHVEYTGGSFIATTEGHILELTPGSSTLIANV